jgi:hypothetical protein
MKISRNMPFDQWPNDMGFEYFFPSRNSGTPSIVRMSPILPRRAAPA